MGGLFKKKKKTTTNQTTTNQQTTTVPDTPDIIAARNSVNNVDLTTPINSVYGQMENAVNDEYYEPEISDSMKGRIKTGKLFNLGQRKAGDLANAVAQQEQIKAGNRLSLAGLTAGSSSSGSGTLNGVTRESMMDSPFDNIMRVAGIF